MPEFRIIGVSMEEIDDAEFRAIAEEACARVRRATPSAARTGRVLRPALLRAARAGAGGAGAGGRRRPKRSSGPEMRLLHYLSVPPTAAPDVIQMLGDAAGSAERSRVIMEKPFGTDLASARELNADGPRGLRRGRSLPHRPLPRQGGGAEHPRAALRQRPVRADLEPQPHRPRPDRRPGDARGRHRAPPSTRRPAPSATWSSPTCSRSSASSRWSRRPRWRRSRSPRRRTRSSAAMQPLDPEHVVRGQYEGYRDEEGVDPDSETETFVALRCESTTGAGAGCRSTCAPASGWRESARIISIAFREPPQRDVPRATRGVGRFGPDHLTFDLDESSRISLSFYGKRPGPGMELDKASMQFSLRGNRLRRRDALEAYERLIHDAMIGDRTLFTTRRGDRAALGDLRTAAARPAAGEALPAGLLGAGGDRRPDRAARWRLPFARRWREAPGARQRRRRSSASAPSRLGRARRGSRRSPARCRGSGPRSSRPLRRLRS